MAKTSRHAFKAKDTRFAADWLKSKGLHKLCSLFEGIQVQFILSLVYKSVVYLTNRFHVAVRLFSNRSQMTSKCGKNKKVAHEA